MIVYGIHSSLARALAQSVNARVNVFGNIEIPGRPRSEMGDNEGGGTNQAADEGNGDGNGQRSCFSHSQCAKGEVCAQPLSVDLPISMTWGRFICVAMGATVQMARGYKQCARGRCLLQEDGTIFVEPNATDLVPEKYYTVYENQTHEDPPLANQTKEVESTAELGNFTVKFNVTENAKSTKPGTFPPLICPCNCTYLAFSCCFSTFVNDLIIFEEEINYGTPGPSLHCDEQSGNWTSSNGTANATATTILLSSTSPSSMASVSAEESEALQVVASNVPERSLINLATFSASSSSSALATPSAHPICQSIGNFCASFWSCGDGEHCYCGAIPKKTLGVLYHFECWAKVGFGPDGGSSGGGDRKRLARRREEGNGTVVPLPEAPVFEDAICPCNCTYSSHACCEKPSGILQEDPQSNHGPVQLPVGHCCDKSDGSVKVDGSCTS